MTIQDESTITINPCIDFAFKKLFGSEENKDLLISLINAILQLPVPIADVTIKNPYNISDYYQDKLSILDIKAQDQNGQWFNVEMQMASDLAYDKRALYYWCAILNEQLQQGDLYQKLTKTFSISILGFNLIPTSTQVHNRYCILNMDTCKDDNKHKLLELHYIELEKFKKGYSELSTALDRWLSFFIHAKELKYPALPLPVTLQSDHDIIRAMDITRRLFSREERLMYEQRLRFIRDEFSRMEAALAESAAKGREIGLTEGRKIGKTEGQATLLKRQLTKKFGPLSPASICKLDTATLEQLETWSEAILDCDSIEQLLR